MLRNVIVWANQANDYLRDEKPDLYKFLRNLLGVLALFAVIVTMLAIFGWLMSFSFALAGIYLLIVLAVCVAGLITAFEVEQ